MGEIKSVIVTTEFRGVFYGRLVELDESKPDAIKAVLQGARNVLYWPTEVGGFGGLASRGALDGTRLGATVERLTLYGVTSVVECSPSAIASFEK